MAGINKVIIVGRMGGDPEMRTFQSGDQMCEFSVATSDTWRDKQTGERKEKTQWHRIKVLNNSLVKNVIEQYLRKGSLVGVEGELQNEEWEKDGVKRITTKVVVTAFRGTVYLLGSKDDGGGSSGGSSQRSSASSGGNGQSSSSYSGGGRPSSGYSADIDDDIPFAPEWR
ncbi:single-stranded DNA-binding protein [Kaistia sp. MMO-174]|uniref:single-stranded DNA-binding protein n=1 Tax=Kaistia sp. MMO-174 TaxID=3081256 RepID=UPI0030166B8E